MDFNGFHSGLNQFLSDFNKEGFTSIKVIKSIIGFFTGGKEEKRERTKLNWDSKNAAFTIKLIAYLFAFWTLKNS